MSENALERVLNAKNLPSLPAVAVQVLELTRDPNVSLDDIAAVIQNDQAIAAKVLRTVNSSYFGLSQPVSTISRAIGYLGLNAVKSLVLGFSLVDLTSDLNEAFDLESYWRRSIYAAAAARRFANEATRENPDEAFCAALFADVGMLAAFVALKEEYNAVLSEAPDTGERLIASERKLLGFDHAKAGAELTIKWKLPEQLAEAIAGHHDGEKAAGPNAKLVRTVALAVLAAECFCSRASSSRTNQLLNSFRSWFSTPAKDVEPLLERVQEDAAQLGKLFDQEVSDALDASSIMSEASEQLTTHTLVVQQESANLRQANEQLQQQSVTDGLTQIGNRKKFDTELASHVENAKTSGQTLAMLFVDGDRFKSINDTHGHQAGDAVLVAIAQRITNTLGDRGVACRYGGEEFAVLIPDADIDRAAAIGDECRAAVCAEPVDTGVEGVPPLTPSVSVGVAVATDAQLDNPGDLVERADQAVYRAKENGRNRVERDGDAAAPAAPPASAPQQPPTPKTLENETLNVLLIEDDPLAAKLLQVVLARSASVRTFWLDRGDAAIRFINHYDPTTSPPLDLILTDINLPGNDGLEIIRAVRASGSLAAVPVVALTAQMDPEMRQPCLDAGATAFMAKDEVSRDTGAWIRGVLGAARKAA